MIEEFKHIVEPFGLNTLQKLNILFERIEASGMSFEEYKRRYDELIEEKKEAVKIDHEKFSLGRIRKAPAFPAPTRCEKCGKRLVKVKVNHHPGAMIGGGYTFATVCKNGCLDTQYY